jgi:hypothetical protein
MDTKLYASRTPQSEFRKEERGFFMGEWMRRFRQREIIIYFSLVFGQMLAAGIDEDGWNHLR